MKLKTSAIFAALLLSAGFVFAATNDITTLLQKGLFEEEANHNLEAAMRHYQAAIDGFDKDRQLAATAVFRLGECLRKLGKTSEADAQYQRVLRDFADQTTLAGLSREYLAGKTPLAAATGEAATAGTSAEDEEVRHIREMIRNSPDLINAPVIGGYTPLQRAISSGNVAAAELLLANGANVNDTGTQSATPLGMAAGTGNKAMIELLLAKGAQVNAADRDSTAGTPLYHAVTKGFKTAAEVLIAHKADINVHRPNGFTLLHDAASRGFSAVAEVLIANGAEVNAVDKDGNTPLFFAVRDNRPEVVQLLLAHKAEVNFTNSFGQTPLFWANQNIQTEVRHQGIETWGTLFWANQNIQTEVARLLLAAKAEVNHRDKPGFTPLFDAVQSTVHDHDFDLVRLLLGNKADVNAATGIGVTPLLFAASVSVVDINLVKLLLENGADPQAHIKEVGSSMGNISPTLHALDLAIEADRPDEMELLLAAHADPNARYLAYNNGQISQSFTPLLLALAYGRPKVTEELQILLDHGADPDLADLSGRTPLSQAVGSGHLNLVQLLLDHHADVNKPDNQGLPPLAYVRQQDPEIRAALLKAGANEDFQRLARIFIAQKGTGTLGQEVFYNGTNAVNHLTLLEALAVGCEHNDGAVPVAFPDLAHVVINRLKAGGGKEEINVNLAEILTSGDCSKDVPLEWGDVIQIPQSDHLLNQSSPPLDPAYREALIKCLRRQVQIIVKGQTTKLTLTPNIPEQGSFNPGNMLMMETVAPGQPSAAPVQKYLSTFSLNDVVHQANVLLLSSDLSRVKVTRHGTDLFFNLEPPASAHETAVPGPGGMPGRRPIPGRPGSFRTYSTLPASADLWLRDGDLIAIPERDPNASAVK